MPKQSANQMVYHLNPQALARLLRGREQYGEASYAVRTGDMGQGMLHFSWGLVRVFFEAEMARWTPPLEGATYQYRQGISPCLAPADKDVAGSWEKLEQRPSRALLHVSNALAETAEGTLYRKCTNGSGGVVWLMKDLTDLLATRATDLRLELRFEVVDKHAVRVSKPQNPYAMSRGDATTYETISYFASVPALDEDLGASLPPAAPAYLFTCLLCGKAEQEQEDDTARRQAKLHTHLMAEHALGPQDIQRATRGERMEWVISPERAAVLHLPQAAVLLATREERFDHAAPQGAQEPLET